MERRIVLPYVDWQVLISALEAVSIRSVWQAS